MHSSSGKLLSAHYQFTSSRFQIGVAVVTRAGESELSDYQVNRTGIARPGSPPADLEAVPVNTTTADVFWRPPAIPNGPIAYYEARFGYLNFRSEPVDSPITRVYGTTTKIGSLLPYTQYEVRTRACTQQSETSEALCGREWASASFTTGIGGEPPHPLIAPRTLICTKVVVMCF
jgi:hypothetical protein